MKALTLNIHSHSNIHDEKEYQQMVETFTDWILQENIEMIALQECSQNCAYDSVGVEHLPSLHTHKENLVITKDNCALMIVDALKRKGAVYDWTWCSAKLGYGKYDEGLAIISRYPILDTEEFYISALQDYNNWKTRKIIGCKINTGEQDSWFYSVHMGWWKDEEEPFIPQMERIQEHLASKTENTYLMGDFNSPSDVEGEGYDHVRQLGWQDTYELAENKDTGISVPGKIDGWQEGAESGLRIDYIWANHPVKVLSSRIMFDGSKEPVISDHFGVCITIEQP